MLRSALFSALGLMPMGCGGASTSANADSGGDGAKSGAPTHGGSATQGATGGDAAAAGETTTSGGTAVGGAAGSGVAGAGASGGSAAGAAAGGMASGATGSMFPCEDSKPDGGGNTGYERCGNNHVLHRVAEVECPSTGPGPYTCVTDHDCTEAGICVCAGGQSYCAQATCRVDADCGAGFLCRGYNTSECGLGGEKFACQTAEDVCATGEDCGGSSRCGADSGSFQCDVPHVNPACGRPFLVEGAERVAPVTNRSDWRVRHRVLEGVELPGASRQRAAAAWTRIAQLEHASIGAFARFTLQLLQLGAPAELIELSGAAMRDETRHARLAFQLASECAGADVGPGELDVERSLQATSLSQVVELVMKEGCIGETLAALELREAAEHAMTPTLRGVLSRMADDEARHAELAFRFVRWALEQDELGVAPIVARELETALCSTAASAPSRSATSVEEQSLLGFGILTESQRSELQQAALREVIEPCVRALLETSAPSRELGAAHTIRPFGAALLAIS